jgi:hypothetical protein
MAASLSDTYDILKPYAPPRSHLIPELPLLPADRWPELEICVSEVGRGWMTRWLTISGNIETEIRYEGGGHGERVLADGRLIATSSPWQCRHVVAPRIEFKLEGQGYFVPARIDVAVSIWRLLRISQFRLTIAGRTVYDELRRGANVHPREVP